MTTATMLALTITRPVQREMLKLVKQFGIKRVFHTVLGNGIHFIISPILAPVELLVVLGDSLKVGLVDN